MRTKIVLTICLLAVLGGCAVNPVTGQRELTLVSDQQAIAIGTQQYGPGQQMHGGPYRTDPALTEYVNRVGQKLGVASGVSLPYEFVVLNNSTPNAWALPGGKIAINRGLLQLLRNEAELAAVLGHEIAHAAARHGAKRIERGLLTQGVVLGAAIAASGSEYGNYAVGAVAQAGALLGLKYSRDAEREADFYGTEFMAKAGYDPNAAVTLQEKFLQLSDSSQQITWLASHPTSQERVNNNRQHVRQLRQQGYEGGTLAGLAYQAATETLRRHAEAYDQYDEAVARLGDNELEAALVQVNAALNAYPAEALFHGLRGAIRLQQQRFDDALTNFDRAIDRDSGYFAHYLHRGITHAQAGTTSLAKTDLDRSVRLLPTSLAYHHLGEIAESSGDVEMAKKYYEQASQAGGEAGMAAKRRLVRLEIGDQPAKYVRAQVVVRDGVNLLVVENLAGIELADVNLRVDFATAAGRDGTTIRLATLNEGVQVEFARGLTLVSAEAYAVSASLN